MRILLFVFTITIFFTGCIGDDIIQDTVEATIRIKNPIDSLTVGVMHQFDAIYLNTIGQEEASPISWSSSDESTLSISPDGLAEGLAPGMVTLEASLDENAEIIELLPIIVTEEMVDNTGGSLRMGTLRTTSSYTLEGDFTMQTSDDKLILQLESNYAASSNLPGLYLYLTNNPNSINNAFEVGAVDIFSGTHSYEIEGIELNAYSHLLYYCKPFGVKVGDGEFEN